MPSITTARTATTHFIGIRLAKFEAPLPHRFIGDNNASLREKLLDVAKTERKAKREPHGVADTLWREAVSFVIRCNGVRFHEVILAHGSTTLPS